MPKTIDSYRTFIAIELSAHNRNLVSKHIDRLLAELPDVRASWTREDNLHLTLKFLGDTPIERIESLSHALERAANQVAGFEIIIKGCGAFPSRGKPKVLWIGISTQPFLLAHSPLAALHTAIENECAAAGFLRDERALHPHLTIARLRQPHGARRLAELHKEMEFDPVAVKVKCVCLIRSELSAAGSRYSIIARKTLKSDTRSRRDGTTVIQRLSRDPDRYVD